ncbi:unnamed protein product [Camellia sinensis]
MKKLNLQSCLIVKALFCDVRSSIEVECLHFSVHFWKTIFRAAFQDTCNVNTKSLVYVNECICCDYKLRFSFVSLCYMNETYYLNKKLCVI